MKKKLDMMQSDFLATLINELNRLEIQKEDIVGFYKENESWKVIFYCNK